MKVADLPEEEFILAGTRACSGCGLSLAYRFALKALGRNTVVTVPASCSTVLHGMYPCAAVNLPMLNTAFETTGASASGIRAGLNAMGKKDVTVLAWAGDGGTTDIGIQALSGAAERRTDIIYACYDNEAYMNTGTQRSGSTPFGAYTTTTPTGKKQKRKNMSAIMAAHGIPYVANTNAAYPIDLYLKFKRANNEFKGDTRYIHIFSPCPPGWGFDTKDLIKIGKMGTLSGIWDLFETIKGNFQLNSDTLKIVQGKKTRISVKEYFKAQKRFNTLTDDDIKNIQEEIDKKFQEYEKLIN